MFCAANVIMTKEGDVMKRKPIEIFLIVLVILLIAAMVVYYFYEVISNG